MPILDYLLGISKPKTMEEVVQNSKAPKCTYCGGTEFFEGPSGGMSTNILCANKNCRHWFNHTPILGSLDDLNYQEPTEEEKVQRRKDEEDTINLGDPRMLVKKNVVYQEGKALFFKGESARNCLQESGRSSSATHSDILRLTGYIDAQREAYKDAINIIDEQNRLRR